ncbi:ankyrin repeat domain-containing protein 54-like [Homarus americanus]|uniref:ankyrin repeat domain-containing protein 54-like n=1 Tax=Homarus americanus TaxID=6706 RepID=UPI001C4854C4|nr:ankyrin repeat domain-containing protein 54-like [Homarus americanus]
MDSGIDSTDSSNGSLEEGGGVVMEGAVSGSAAHNDLPPAPTALRTLAAAAAATNPVPSPLKKLAATALNDNPTVLENRENNNECEVSVDAVDAPASTAPLSKMPKLDVPEGSQLQLHFPVPEDGSSEEGGGTTFELEPPPGLTFANVSPSMYLSRGYDAYSQGYSYSVVPYENNALQKKLRTIRLRMRQQNYQILSPKAKERKLRIAVSLNNVQTVEQLLREGINPKVTDDKERSPLHIAASKGYTDIARLLLQHGADPNQRDAIGNTALHLAACTSHIPTVTLLLKAGTNVRQTDNQGYSPLHLARSKLKLLQRDNNSSSQEIKKQVYQVIEMMQTFLECAGSVEEAELLTSFTSQLSLSDSRQQVESDVQALLNSLNDLSLVKSKAA